MVHMTGQMRDSGIDTDFPTSKIGDISDDCGVLVPRSIHPSDLVWLASHLVSPDI